MTREEAIQILSEYDVNFGYHTEFEIADALAMAIKALEHPEQNVIAVVPCDDAISRQAVLEVIRKCHCEEWIKADIGATIEALSPVKPQEKTGHWLRTGEVDVYYDLPSYECSECGKTSLENGDYCPNCGARMESGDDK